MICNVCFFRAAFHPCKSLFGNWYIHRCDHCVEFEANPLYEIEDRIRIGLGLAPSWVYYLLTYHQSPRSKGGQWFVYSEIA